MKLVKPSEEKNKLLLTDSINSVFHIKRLIIQRYIDVLIKTAYKCKSFIILNDNNKIIKYYNNHNHFEEDYNATMSLLKHEINKSIRNETSLGMKPKLLYNNIEEGNWNKKRKIFKQKKSII